MIFLAPWAGARSDARGKRLPTLRVTTVVAVAATAFLAAFSVDWTLVLLGIALVAFNIGSVAYDALLVDVSTPENRGRISGLGVAIGYIGSFVGLGIGLVTLEVLDWSYSATFVVLALGFLVFALPAFMFIEERGAIDDAPLPRFKDVAAKMAASWRAASRYPGMVRFLIGRFLYTDAINTLIGGFLTIFVLEELEFESGLVTGLLALAIVAAIAGALIAGRLLQPVGPLRVLRGVLVLWMFAIASGVAGRDHRQHDIGLGDRCPGRASPRCDLDRGPRGDDPDLPAAPPRSVLRPVCHGRPVCHHPRPTDVGAHRRRPGVGATGGDVGADPVHRSRLVGAEIGGRRGAAVASRRPPGAQ